MEELFDDLPTDLVDDSWWDMDFDQQFRSRSYTMPARLTPSFPSPQLPSSSGDADLMPLRNVTEAEMMEIKSPNSVPPPSSSSAGMFGSSRNDGELPLSPGGVESARKV